MPATTGPLAAPPHRRLAAQLLAWSETTRRDLPWRRTRDPWAILVSELMLQQTQVSRVEPVYSTFLARFPDPAACAAASVGDVVRVWEGLGYNRRALNLHRTARLIVDEHDGKVPEDLDALLALPGVGPYTARAVLAFAFERDHGVVDTNVARVLARAISGNALTPRQVQDLADEMVPLGRGWAWNQAILDLGATICVKRAPQCERCPVADRCEWARRGFPDPDPADRPGSGRPVRFEGSDRQGRGRLVQALRTGPVPIERLGDAAGWPDEPERAQRAADTLVVDGLAEYADGQLLLP